MFEIQGPAGEGLHIPFDSSEDRTYFGPGEGRQAHEYLVEQGYTVIRGLISAQACDAARQTFAGSIKPFGGYIYRQATANPETHQINDRGFMMNPILNVQDLRTRMFSDFKNATLEVLTERRLQDFLQQHFSEAGKLVQSMYFEGNSATWAHQDTYYLDAEKIGTMVGVWFALEDIRPGAGRFFVYPASHRIDVVKHGGDFDIAFNHDRYKQLIIDIVKQTGLQCAAPALSKGDVLVWNSKTIHGSLSTQQPEFSRSSLTAHYIPQSMRFLQHQRRIKPLTLQEHNGMQVHHPKLLDRIPRRAILKVEITFPKSFQFAKRLAVKGLSGLGG